MVYITILRECLFLLSCDKNSGDFGTGIISSNTQVYVINISPPFTHRHEGGKNETKVRKENDVASKLFTNIYWGESIPAMTKVIEFVF